MEWGFYLLVAMLAAGLGYAGGHAALVTDRRRRRRVDPDQALAEAAFRLEHVDGLTWSLVNVGRASGSLVSVLPFTDGLEQWPPQPVPGRVETAASKLLPTLEPGGSVSVWFSRYDSGQRAIVSWTAENNVRMGPVTLDVPAPG